ncbi:AraC family transcriptional regulator [Streptomyces sp. PCS3-D2]|uniref:AraC-like ligand-binding domain-containing protein n=1 Tax=Streptomyces sp. PCS3-D2 TaxID=1460244 RepID=UPI0009967E52|nr:transcriptional regulator [Streptomyces sp. PCS3-D2]WKV75411.1 AraC family transcriptional regulator [Streptomyces sp. PCS3-D2]
MLLLDLDGFAPKERPDAFHHALTDTSVPNQVIHESPETGIRARFEGWRLGPLDLFDMRSTGFEVRRTARHVRWHRERPVVSVSLQTRGIHRAESAGRRYLLGPDDIAVFHELAPRRYGWSGEGASRAVTIDMEHLGVPVDTVVRASERLRSSPLHDLVLAHLRALWKDPGGLETDPAAAALGNATTELVRALLTSAAHGEDDRRARTVMDDSLVPRIMAYIRRHLTGPVLTADRIARAHAVSRRQLYTVLGRAGIRLEQWVISERLEAACRPRRGAEQSGARSTFVPQAPPQDWRTRSPTEDRGAPGDGTR